MVTKTANRYLCSNLVSLQLPAHDGGDREVVGNLEEISTSAAYLNVEEPIDVGLHLRMVCSNRHQSCELKGAVIDCNHDVSTGYYIDVEFSPGSRWSPEIFKPKHLILATSLLAVHSDGPSPEASCCDRGICPKEVISRILEPECPLTGRVRAVAQEVAALCGGMTESEAVNCFGSLFGAGPECRLFAEFQEAYAGERQRGLHPRHATLRTQVEGLVRLAGAVPTEVIKSNGCAESAPGLIPVIPSSQ